MIRKFALLSLFILACLSPSLAAAQTTLNTALVGVLGQGRLLPIGGTGVSYVRFTLTANRSYYAVCWSHQNTDQAVKCNVDWRDGSDVSVSVTNEMEPFQSPFTTYAGDGDSYLPTVSGSYYVRVSNTSALAYTMDLMVIENTLFSPWYYVLPASGYDSFVQVRNNTAQVISVTLRAYDNSGNIVGTHTQSIAGNGVALVQVSSFVPSGGAGSLSLTFAGPPGSVAANSTTLSGATGLSFDAPFTPRMVWSSFGYLQS